ncbi:hypothetical protein BGW36DRAFT_184492 [Talaromyces proteolyticus]|uniref:C2H2-type domain-containing protein n=1 Tax=Talaromyces proteolyticus TaxID=1131652 RepID=A0AAD4KPS9_9EURO|nr:uncharacterized protein BGW36DRAFT_184492 [Talaromyces proteolyticus]KAH8696318.1 hypothetical protein BGW36DRAFT_184492 [Talaromyces proteolyticus]
MLAVGSGSLDLLDENQHDHGSDSMPAPSFQGDDTPSFDQLPTTVETFTDGMNTTFFSTGDDVANQGADLNIVQGSCYTTPEISSWSVINSIATTDRVLTALYRHRVPEAIPGELETSYPSPRLQQVGGGIQRSLPILLPAPTQHSVMPPRQPSSRNRFQCEKCPMCYPHSQSLNRHARDKHEAPKKKAGRPSNRSKLAA